MNQERITRVPKYVPGEISIKSGGKRGGHGKYADYDDEIRYITNVVGSKSKKDITRKNAFMSKEAFDAWDEKRGNKYAMEDIDLDGDEFPEMVVKNPKGQLVAVNGYTVKRSDWGVRRPFYTEYPTRQARKGQTLGKFVRDVIYETTDDDFDDYGYAKDGYLDRIKNIQSKPQFAGYSMKASTPSSYNLFLSKIIKPSIDYIMKRLSGANKEIIKDIREQCDLDYGKGWMMIFASELWNDWIKNPILKQLSPNIRQYLDKYNENHVDKISNVQDVKFLNWLLNKKEIKPHVRKGFEHIMNNKKAYMNAAVEYCEPRIRESAEKTESFENTEIQPEDVDEEPSELSV